MDGLEELVGDPRDRDVGDLELLFAQQVQQQIERAGEGVELDDEPGAGAERGGRGLSGAVMAERCSTGATTTGTGAMTRSRKLIIATPA